ncbi:DUF3326 domain-containing protein [Gloeobacter kilaueensis]|uniref:DUF3326 domain-containing protein n=1 Tax=Gloeobacter kilaueensis (strain ATCC BAA-2537 / CCAP 1431/1 / ULC 316 / JS1) TaxID=1183438 RepID=U5QEB7_GLOK1|nr:DUF3326 domain-containing protein [Gloeobacter kilaueensis]AGY57266.1 hypothetical protein GKIL_1020 [Gloeobacter kilaueensis JS1]
MRPLTVVLLVPTGVGAAIGGYAGDAIPVARLLAGVADRLVTHPNVLNGALLSWPLPNALYVEGYALDRWCRGEWALRPVHRNRVGVLLDAALSDSQRLQHLQAIEAARFTLGVDILGHCTSEGALGILVHPGSTGTAWGTIAHPDRLLRAAERLVAAGADAIAIVSRCPEVDDSAYLGGRGVDPIGGVEALVSHLVVRHLGRPAAHAPAFDYAAEPQPVHPRVAAEALGPTFLPCVLAGLSTAPRYVRADAAHPSDLLPTQVDAIVAPVGCSGGPGLLALMAQTTPPVLLAVEENLCRLDVTPERLGLKARRVRSYLEACGWLVALKQGVALAEGTVCAIKPDPHQDC